MYDEYLAFCHDHLQAFEGRLKSQDVFILNQKILGFFGSSDTKLNPWNPLCTVLMRMSIPNDQSDFYPWLLQNSSDFARCRRLNASMESSKLIQQSQKARRDIILTNLKPSATAKAKAGPKDRVLQKVVKEQVEDTSGKMTFLSLKDDIKEAINSALEAVADEDIKHETVLRAYAMGVVFVLTENVNTAPYSSTGTSQRFSKYPDVRNALRQYLAEQHDIELRVSDDSFTKALEEDSLLGEKVGKDLSAEDPNVDIRLDIVKSIIKDLSVVGSESNPLQKISHVLAQNPSPDADADNFNTDVHVGYITASRAMVKMFKDKDKWNAFSSQCTQSLTAGTAFVVAQIVDFINTQLNFRLVMLAASLNDYIETSASMEEFMQCHPFCKELAQAFHEDINNVLWFMQLRPLHIFTCLTKVSSIMATATNGAALEPHIEAVATSFAELAQVEWSRSAMNTVFEYDLQQESIGDVVDLWKKFVSRAPELKKDTITEISEDDFVQQEANAKKKLKTLTVERLRDRIQNYEDYPKTFKLFSKDQLVNFIATADITKKKADYEEMKGTWNSTVSNVFCTAGDSQAVVVQEVQCQSKLLEKIIVLHQSMSDKARAASIMLTHRIQAALLEHWQAEPDTGLELLHYEKGKVGKKPLLSRAFLVPSNLHAWMLSTASSSCSSAK